MHPNDKLKSLHSPNLLTAINFNTKHRKALHTPRPIVNI